MIKQRPSRFFFVPKLLKKMPNPMWVDKEIFIASLRTL